MIHDEKTIKRFIAKVQTPGNSASCWFWSGPVDEHGYGMTKVARKTYRAHRLSWEIHNDQAFPAGLIARHTCDNPPCVNPLHIIPGTHHENVMDSVTRGRWTGRSGHRLPCRQGHPATDENSYFNGGRRWCKACRQRSYEKRLKGPRPLSENPRSVYMRQYRQRKRERNV